MKKKLHRNCEALTSWWLNHPRKEIPRQIGSFPQILQGENSKKSLETTTNYGGPRIQL